VGTANVGSRAPACPPFIVALRERGPTAIHGRRPRSGRGLIGFPIWRSGDHFPNILFYREVCRRSSTNATTGTISLFAFPVQEHSLTCLCIRSNRALYNYLSNPLMFIIATISILAVLFFVFAHGSLLNTNCSTKYSYLNRS
jgi:hypothetical protein